MTTPYMLLIAPHAPPKNSPESIQVRRILAELDRRVSGRLVTVAETGGWSQVDASLELPLANFDRQTLTLPWHRLAARVLMSHRLAALHVPDAMFWIRWMAGRVVHALPRKPDIIYSRSQPMSAALLALKLKQTLQVPWIMHLSDPWADNPYGSACPHDAVMEEHCFRMADSITVTTQGQATHYQNKYPHAATKLRVSPNVMPETPMVRATQGPQDNRLHLVYAGNFYGKRSPQPLIDALNILCARQPEVLRKLRIDVYGRAQEPGLSMLHQQPDVLTYHGPVSFAQASAAQDAADVVLSMEPQTDHPLIRSFLPSKVLDCLASGKPLLAITPDGSETAVICDEGYGWAISPNAPEKIATLLAELTGKVTEFRAASRKTPPMRYSASAVVDDLLQQMQQLMTRTP